MTHPAQDQRVSMGGRSSNKKDDTMTTPHADNLPGSGRADLTMVLLRSRELGFLGPGEVESHIRNATAFLPGIDQTLAERPLGDTGRFIMIDLGSGGGVPGLVLATLRPDLRIVLIDAAQRRTEFLNWAVDRLGIGTRVLVERGRAEVLAMLVEGFFPKVAVSDKPLSRARGALTQLGLPYAQDAAVTRHLAAFLSRQAGATEQIAGLQGTQPAGASFLHPTAILFNGGVLKAAQIEQRILDVVNGWLAAEGAQAARQLDGANLDLAVARGAAYYGHVRQGRGVRIRGGTAQSYYVGVESNMPAIPGMEPPISALCLAPFGMEEGTEVALDAQQFGLVVGEPVRLRFFGSSVRRSDAVGTMLDFWGPEELVELQEIEAHLPAEGRASGEVVPVTLHARVTDIGTLELNAVPVGGSERWKVEFDVRAETTAADAEPAAS